MSNGKTFRRRLTLISADDPKKYRGSIEGEQKLRPHSALPLNCLSAKKLTGSGRHFGSATGIANSNKPALSYWPLATSNGKSNRNSQTQEPQLTARATTKPFATDPRPAGTGLRLCATIRNSVTTLVNTARGLHPKNETVRSVTLCREGVAKCRRRKGTGSI